MPNPNHETRADARAGWQLFALSFAALFLELMLIRWVPAVVRLVAYYANLMLISSFLGLGLGAMLANRGKKLWRLFPLLMLMNVLVLIGCARILLPGSQSESRFFSAPVPLLNYFSLIAVFVLNTVLFIPLGERLGELFTQVPPLRAYAWDLSGSLAGTLCFGAFSLLHFSATIGVFAVLLIYLVIARGRTRVWGIVLLPVAVVLVIFVTDPFARWSPYHYITIAEMTPTAPEVHEPPPGIRTMLDPPLFWVRVGRDFYQRHGTLDVDRYSPGLNRAWVQTLRDQYMLAYQIAPHHEKVAIMGAGGGIDVQAALLAGASSVDAVEIDPTIVAISRQFSASGVYFDPRVTIHIDDARAFLRKSPGGYDVIAFGYLDSQSLFSSMSNVRIDGFIYTVESLRTAWSRLSPDGLLAVSFYARGEWLAPKLVQTIRAATGVDPIVYGNAGTIVICVPKGAHLPLPESFGDLHRANLEYPPLDLPTDDWPFLYLNKRTIPSDYLLVIGTLATLSVIVVASIRGRKISADDAHFFAMGFAFLLLQTKSITDCSLYFGTTWLVTTIVVAGVLVMVLAANLTAMRWMKSSATWPYIPLIAALLLLYFVPREFILGQNYGTRLAWAMLAVPLPIFFAGLIFSTTFRATRHPSLAFGANLIGATIGGFCEYLGMAIGTRALTLFVIGAYLASLIVRAVKRRTD